MSGKCYYCTEETDHTATIQGKDHWNYIQPCCEVCEVLHKLTKTNRKVGPV